MKRRVVVTLCFLVLVILGAAGFSAAANNEKPAYVGDGQQISLFGSPVKYVDADSSFYIRQGWGGYRYPGSVPDFKELWHGVSNMGGALFELYIDGVEVKLSVQNRNFDVPAEVPSIYRTWYAQFDAGDFAPGTHEVTGVWSSRNPQSVENVASGGSSSLTITLVVVP